MSKARDEKRAALGLTDRMTLIGHEVFMNLYNESIARSSSGLPSTRTWSGNLPNCDDLVDLYLEGVLDTFEAAYIAMERVKEYDRVNHLMETGTR